MAKKCIICKTPFTPKRSSLEKCCSEYDCKVEYALIIAEKQKSAKIKKAKQEWNKEKIDIKERIKTLAEWKHDLQVEINTLIREIDKGHLCISSRKSLNNKFDAGHFYSRGSNPSLMFHLMNIYAQSVQSNQHLSGDQINFLEGLEIDFGKEHKEYVLSLKKLHPILKITIEDIKPKIPLVRSLIKWIRLQDRKFTNEERIFLRKEFNEKIGIYNKHE